jgi:hypothetical protein
VCRPRIDALTAHLTVLQGFLRFGERPIHHERSSETPAGGGIRGSEPDAAGSKKLDKPQLILTMG